MNYWHEFKKYFIKIPNIHFCYEDPEYKLLSNKLIVTKFAFWPRKTIYGWKWWTTIYEEYTLFQGIKFHIYGGYACKWYKLKEVR